MRTIRDIWQNIPSELKKWFWVGFGLRFVAIFFSGTAPDFVGYRLPIAECIASGSWLYCDCAYNHTPFYPYLSGLMNLLSGGIPLLQTVLITLPLAIGDGLVPLALYFLLLNFDKKAIAQTAGIIYALNPLSIIEVGIAHWDGFTTLFFLLAMLSLQKKQVVPTGIFAGLGVLLKQFPLAIVLISFARDRNFGRAFIIGVITVGLVLLGFLPFILKCPDTFFQNLLSHPLWQGVASVGVDIGTIKSVFLNLQIPYPKVVWAVIFITLLAIPFFKTTDVNYFYYTGLVMVTLAYFTFVTHRQLIVWCLPFLIAITLEKRSYLVFVLVFLGYAIRILKPDWWFGFLHLGVGVWFYMAFYQKLSGVTKK